MTSLSIGATRRRRLATRLLSAVSLLTGLLGLIGFAHTPAGKPLLSWLARTAGCPVDLEGGDAAQVEAFRQQQGQRVRGLQLERARPALGFTLGVTTREHVVARLGGAIDCAWSRQQTVLRCNDQGLRLAGGVPLADLHLQFNVDGRLVAVDAWHAPLAADQALDRLSQRRAQLDQEVGAFTDSEHPMDANTLAQAPLRRTAVAYRYRNYVARISATNLGARGVRVREQYQWFAPTTGT